MKRLFLIAALLALPCVSNGATIVGQLEYATTARDTLWLTADTLHVDTGGPADTLGPAYIGECNRVRVTGSWKGDSLAVYIETSSDKVNWATPYSAFDGDLHGTAAAQGNYLATVMNDFAPAAAATIGSSASCLMPWVRVRFVTTSTVPAYTLNLRGRIACVR